MKRRGAPSDADMGSNVRARTRYGLTVILLALFVALGGLLWQVIDSRAVRRDIVLKGNQALAEMATRVVEPELKGRLRRLEGVAHRPDVITSAAAGDWSRLSVYLQALRGLDPELISTAMLDAAGKLGALDPPDPSVLGMDFSSRDYFRGALASQGPYVSEAFRQRAEPKVVVVAFSVAVRDPSGALVGVLVSTLPIKRFGLVSAEVDVPNGGSLRIFDQSGHELTETGTGDLRTFTDHPVISKALHGESGVMEAALPGSTGSRLVAHARVPEVGWAVIVEQPRSAAFKPITELTRRLAGVAGLVTLVALISSLMLVRLIRALGNERTRTAAILDSAAEGVVTTDLTHRILSMNPAMERLSGWSTEEAIGGPYADFFHFFDADGEPIPHEHGPLAQAMASKAPVASHGFGLILLNRAGVRIPVTVTAAPILDETGDTIGGVDVIRDASLEREVDQMKSTFVSTVSHELRTPLTMIQGFSELLLSRDVGQKDAKDALEQINRSALRLGRLIEDLLSVSRIESGRLTLRTEPLDLHDAIDEALRPFAGASDIRVELDDPLPQVLADKDMLIQVLTNLISNAEKYSPPGSPITVRARADGATAEISVKDEGIGLSEEELSHLFEKFYRVDREEVRHVGGTGLGLFITKNLVEKQRGRIRVSSGPGKGSTFTFSLPLREAREVVR